MVEMWDVHFASLRELDAPKHLFRATPKARISLGNGTEQLSPHFASVETRTWQDQLQFADADPFLATRPRQGAGRDRGTRLLRRHQVHRHLRLLLRGPP
jgi:hypothetical protein